MLDVIDPRFDEIESDHDRGEAWTRVVSTVVRPTLSADVAVPRFARFHSWRLGGLILNEIAATSQVFERTDRLINTQNVDHIMVSILTYGKSLCVTSRKEQNIPVGSIRFTDLSQEYRLHTFGMRGINIIVPRRYLELWLGDASSLHQLVVPPRGQPLVRLLGDQIRNTHACIDQADAAQKKNFADAMIAILVSLLISISDSNVIHVKSTSIEIRRFIEKNLGNGDLNTDLLCSHFGLSRSPIYEIFESDGGVMTYIRNRRLAWAMRMLSGIEGSQRKRISEIAYGCGYDTLKAFSKAFKAKYGVVPRDVDAVRMDDEREEASAAMLNWILEL